MNLIDQLGLTLPLVQAPMAGVSTPALAAAVCNAGALGSLGLGATNAAGARTMIDQVRQATNRLFNVNLFVHRPAVADATREQGWLNWLGPLFQQFGAAPPTALREIYRSFLDDPEMRALLLETRPGVISFHFGLPDSSAIAALKASGAILLASATNLTEARLAEQAGIDGVIAQGIEAGGHRGVFDPQAPDEALSTLALTRLLVKNTRLPVIAAGGIMDGAGIKAALTLGAVAAQLGTAFIACPESAADAAYRAALLGPDADKTRLTRLISGRPARCLANRFTALVTQNPPPLPDYPIAYDAGKALNAAAKAAGESGFGAQWAGQGAALARAMPAAALVAALRQEMEAA